MSNYYLNIDLNNKKFIFGLIAENIKVCSTSLDLSSN